MSAKLFQYMSLSRLTLLATPGGYVFGWVQLILALETNCQKKELYVYYHEISTVILCYKIPLPQRQSWVEYICLEFQVIRTFLESKEYLCNIVFCNIVLYCIIPFTLHFLRFYSDNGNVKKDRARWQLLLKYW